MTRIGHPTVTNMSEQMFLWMNPDINRICGCGSNQPKKFISYTFSFEIEKNISKHEASIEQGWNHLIVVVYPKEESWKELFLERLRNVLGIQFLS